MALSFVKMQALGNDFLIIDDRGKPPGLEARLSPERARSLCENEVALPATPRAET
jgi:diaminopimelate epimerase